MRRPRSRPYLAHSAMSSTGEDTSKLIRAPSAEDDQMQANHLGMMVSGVELLDT